MVRRSTLVRLAGILGGALLLIGCGPTNPPEDVQARDQLIAAVKSSRVGDEIDLTAVIDDQWDRLVVLPPYATNDDAADVLGFPFNVEESPTSVDDSGSVFVFAEGDAVAVWFTPYWRDVSFHGPRVIPAVDARVVVSLDSKGFYDIDLVGQ